MESFLSFNLKKSLITLIYSYQKFISVFISPRCRFRPTCSEYSIQAISRLGIIQGSILTIKRIVKCHPLNLSCDLNDPVPEEKKIITRED
ncbi:MAG: membrane protein insertion efficiency factor YidD [Candidatus Dasytiphilus stammeri]